jgi:beta-N-acetylhexosaminidase
MLKAVHSGEITQQQIDISVLKILKAKASLGLHQARLADLDNLSTLVGKPENIAVGEEVADDAVTLVRDNGKLLPLKRIGTTPGGLPYTRVEEVHNHLVVVILGEDLRTETGRTLERQIKARVPDAHVLYLDTRISGVMSNDVLTAVDGAETVIAAAYVIPTAGRANTVNGVLQNTVSLTDANGALLQQILAHASAKTIVLAMGNPYLATDFPSVENHGHLPVTIPGIAARGAGIERPSNVAQGVTNASPSSH